MTETEWFLRQENVFTIRRDIRVKIFCVLSTGTGNSYEENIQPDKENLVRLSLRWTSRNWVYPVYKDQSLKIMANGQMFAKFVFHNSQNFFKFAKLGNIFAKYWEAFFSWNFAKYCLKMFLSWSFAKFWPKVFFSWNFARFCLKEFFSWNSAKLRIENNACKSVPVPTLQK